LLSSSFSCRRLGGFRGREAPATSDQKCRDFAAQRIVQRA
jgi:hypothetical protein